jgi:hypothetical protein
VATAESRPCSRSFAQRGRDAESNRKPGVWAPVNKITAG